MLRNIEIWDINDDLTGTNNNGTLLDDSDDHQFFTYDYGEIIRINNDQCEVLNPWSSWKIQRLQL